MSQDMPSTPPAKQGLFRRHLADYDAELRLPNGRVDTNAMVKWLKELGVTTYYGMAEQSAKVLPADRYELRFLERDDFTGATAGYHYKQLLLDGTVVWEEDVGRVGRELGIRSQSMWPGTCEARPASRWLFGCSTRRR
jgi:hypothetical protein